MTVKCKCPNCGYYHLVDSISGKIKQLLEEDKEQDGLPSEN